MTQLTRSDWEQRARSLNIEGRAFINGQYVFAEGGATFDCFSPVDGRFLASVASTGKSEADAAVAAARQAFESGVWSRMAPVKRKQILVRFADLIEANLHELALLETLDMGKPISDSLTLDIPGAAEAIRWCAEAIDKVYDEIAPTSFDQLCLVKREPAGVVAAIVPWNFPLKMASWKLGPALASGNSVVLKPSEKSPLTAIRIAQLAYDAGLPAGVLNVLPGLGHVVGKALGEHPDVDVIAFTGSTRVAKQLLGYAGASNMKRVWLEAGGKSPNIVFADAPDLVKAASSAALAIAFNQGEVCNAASRLLVQDSIKDQFMPLLLKALAEWRPGHALDPVTRVGAMVDSTQLETVMTYLEVGVAEGAKLIHGGARVLEETGGLYLEPAVFDGVENNMRIAQEEIFGPVLSVITFSNFDEAIRIANDSSYGLAAAVWTSDISKAHKAAGALRAGTVEVNQYFGGDMTTPFGGYKQSGNGRDKSLHAFDKYMEVKATLIAL